MITRAPCFIVAEKPEPIRTEIQSLRDAFATPTAALPVEITLLGSSGVGPIPIGTPVALIQEQMQLLFSKVSPWKVAFSGIRIFPNTSIAYLAPFDRSRFDFLHNLCRDSALPSSPSRFPYNPHCTLRAGGALTPDQLSDILSHQFPKSIFEIDTISVYDLDINPFRCNLICQKQLRA